MRSKKKTPIAGEVGNRRSGNWDRLGVLSIRDDTSPVIQCQVTPSDYTTYLDNLQYDPLELDAALASANADMQAATTDDDWVDSFIAWIELHTLKCGQEVAK